MAADQRKSLREKVIRLFSRFPKDPEVRPAAFNSLSLESQEHVKAIAGTLVFQSVPDRFYFLLFGAIRMRLKASLCGRAELVVVRAISGAVGTGWKAKLKRTAPIAWLWSRPWVHAYGTHIDGVAYRCASWAHPLSDLVDWIRSGRLWRQLQQQGEDYSLRIEGVEVADLIIDSYLRFKPSPEFDVTNSFVRWLVWQALRDVRQAQTYFRHARPCLYLTSYTTYLEHGIPVRVALKHGVNVWAFGNLNGFGKQLSLDDFYHTQDFSNYKNKFDSLDRQIDRLQEAREQLENRLSGGIDIATSYMRQSAYIQSPVELPSGLDGAVVVFLHDFYDSPHIYPEMVFHDFWRWICFTIEVLQKSGAPFFLKPHPNQIALSGDVLGSLRQKYPSVQWLPTVASNVLLAQAGIACGVTVYGTVAHELAYLGVPSICCARHPHYTFSFCRTARTRAEYESMLRTYGVLPVSKMEMQRQALAFYYMHNLHGLDDERELQQAFVTFWKACNVGDVHESVVTNSFQAFINHPAFNKFVDLMMTDCER